MELPPRAARVLLGALSLVALAAALYAARRRSPPPAPRTLRVDYSHTGTARGERFGLDRVVLEPLPWPGHPSRALDDTNLGKYLFEVVEPKTGRVLYSRGFASVFGEWETTPEAKEREATFSESVRFPAPAGRVELRLKKRDATNAFAELWKTDVDPGSAVATAASSPAPLLELERHGPSADKVDLLLLGDGYTAAERGKFERDARRLVDILFSTAPFRERRSDFNVWGLCPAAAESGISRPSAGVRRTSPVGATYDAFGSERYILTFENHAMRDLASFAPYEFIEILTNSDTYGGGGIFNLYSTVAADSAWAPYVFIHELGHHFAALADEYYTSDVAYEAASERLEPWEPNVTALRDRQPLKWGDLVKAGTPLPTRWSKDAYEATSRDFQARRRKIRADHRPEAEMDALFAEQKLADTKLLSSDAHAADVGAFEGAMYEAKGYFRPQEDCIMYSRDEVPFCAVCQRAISRVIDLYSR